MNSILKFVFSDTGKGQIRHILTFVAGLLVAKGVFTQGVSDQLIGSIDPLFTAIGAVIGIFGSIWSAKAKPSNPSE